MKGRNRSGLSLTNPCETQYPRISICGTATTDFASLKVKFNCDAASRNLFRLVVVSFTGSIDGYIIEVSISPLLASLRNDDIGYSLESGYAVGNTKRKTSILVKFPVSLKRGVHAVFWI